MHFRPAFLMFALTGTLACSDIPVIESTRDAAALSAPFPSLVPISGLLAGSSTAPQITPEQTANMTARINALRSRAAQLNRPVVDTTTRSRMRGAIARAALR